MFQVPDEERWIVDTDTWKPERAALV
jgi:hypothetical protein